MVKINYPTRQSRTPPNDILEWAERGGMRSEFEREIIGANTKRRLEIPVKTAYQISRAGKILEELGRKMQITAQYRESTDPRGGRDERVKVIEASYQLHRARQALKDL